MQENSFASVTTRRNSQNVSMYILQLPFRSLIIDVIMCQVNKKEPQIKQTDKTHNFFYTDNTKAMKPLEKPIVGFSHEKKIDLFCTET